MALPVPAEQRVKRGWIRALSLFIVYAGLSTVAGFFVSSTQEWIVITFVLAFALVYAACRFIDNIPFESVGLQLSALFPHSVTGVALAAFILSTGTIIIHLLGGIIWIDIVAGGTSLFTDLVLMLMVAFSEELVFRGYVLRNLAQSMNTWLAIFLSAVLFTLVHAANPGIPLPGLLNTFLGGMLLGVTFIYSSNLWLPILFHFSWNFLQGPILGFNVSGLEFKSLLILEPKGAEWISGGEYGFEGSFVASGLLLLALLFWVYLQMKRTKPLKVDVSS